MTEQPNTADDKTDTGTAFAAAPIDDPSRAQADRKHAEELRQRAEAARAEAETLVETARAQAARLVSEAEARARVLGREADAAAKQADGLDAHATLVDHARASGEQADKAEQRVAALAAERVELEETVAEANARLAELAEQARNTAAEIEQAREAGDVDRLAEARNRAASLNEVTAVVTGRRNAAKSRCGVVGDLGWGGELDQAIAAAQAARGRAEGLLDQLDPERAERRKIAIFQNTLTRLRKSNPDSNPTAAALLTLLATEPGFAEALLPAPAEPGPRTVVSVSTDGRSAQIARG